MSEVPFVGGYTTELGGEVIEFVVQLHDDHHLICEGRGRTTEEANEDLARWLQLRGGDIERVEDFLEGRGA